MAQDGGAYRAPCSPQAGLKPAATKGVGVRRCLVILWVWVVAAPPGSPIGAGDDGWVSRGRRGTEVGGDGLGECRMWVMGSRMVGVCRGGEGGCGMDDSPEGWFQESVSNVPYPVNGRGLM